MSQEIPNSRGRHTSTQHVGQGLFTVAAILLVLLIAAWSVWETTKPRPNRLFQLPAGFAVPTGLLPASSTLIEGGNGFGLVIENVKHLLQSHDPK